MPSLFDPLKALEGELDCPVDLDEDGQPRLTFTRFHRPEEVAKAQAILRRYSKLVTMQLREGRCSVQKLIVRGLVVLKAGRYVEPEKEPENRR